jgi:hypothetical protein
MQVVVNVAVIRRGWLALAAALILCAPANAPAQSSPPSDVPVENWLHGSDRQDFPWRVRITQPWLTFQQRHLVQVWITVRARDLLHSEVSPNDLCFVIKVAGEDGRWLPGQAYSRFEPAAGLAPSDEIHSVANIYVREGNYAVAAMVYDSRNRRGNLWRGNLHVGPVKNDPLPGMERDLPRVEFLPPVKPLRLGRSRGLGSMITFDPWAIGAGDLLLPVANERPVLVDVAANVSLSEATDTRYSEAPEWEYQLNGGQILQISNVLSQLDLKAGCVRFGAFDLRRQKIFANHTDASRADWTQVGREIRGLDRNKIEAITLARQKQQPAFLARYLEQLSEGSNPCELLGPRPLRILIVVSDAFLFPDRAHITTVQPSRMQEGFCYYLRVVPVSGASWDQIERVLKPLRPFRFDFSDATRFRKSLAQLMRNIESVSRERVPRGR